ncbi:hypothetical protein OZ410_13220 [Robiginitalea sp. M366]|uniref:hypothetical protein n=1 Tax=Robiginitalea aestuariiviva TaxID=3036903 RepID=UPI00240D2CAB|nr:hypothetical protein [Robiginitalea aestuariiviva]MDG1573283.1 hypothetical protein [Robiginitalea aestuariiviva]
MSQITYLFGAGASFHALPIVSQIPERLRNCIIQIKGYKFDNKVHNQDHFYGNNKLPPIDEILNTLVSDLEWLERESSHHQSVDTLAKKLEVKGDYNGLNRLKLALSVIFTYEQIRNPIDKRYDSFLASLLDRNGNLPPKLTLLTWNYDMQLELAFREYLNHDSLHTSRNGLNIRSRYTASNRKAGL